ncbi:hypothetical protein RIF29_28993 [Crotalaria pallida]|uniref:Uncharacterized protein n=1 Tax=Crotalaria pallida TaxID=3830 RepID=A0AAN9HX22_CROPI
MFSQNMDSAGAVAGTVLIYMRFVWPYGGRSVFLSGGLSFYQCQLKVALLYFKFFIAWPLVTIRYHALVKLLPRISDADVQISHQRISAFLSMHTTYELLSETGKV